MHKLQKHDRVSSPHTHTHAHAHGWSMHTPSTERGFPSFVKFITPEQPHWISELEHWSSASTTASDWGQKYKSPLELNSDQCAKQVDKSLWSCRNSRTTPMPQLTVNCTLSKQTMGLMWKRGVRLWPAWLRVCNSVDVIFPVMTGAGGTGKM